MVIARSGKDGDSYGEKVGERSGEKENFPYGERNKLCINAIAEVGNVRGLCGVRAGSSWGKVRFPRTGN